MFTNEQIEEAKAKFKAELEAKPPSKGGQRVPYVAFLRVAREGRDRIQYLDVHFLDCSGTSAQKSVVDYYFAKSLGIISFWFPSKNLVEHNFTNGQFTTHTESDMTTAKAYKHLADYCTYLGDSSPQRVAALKGENEELRKEKAALLKKVNSGKKGGDSDAKEA